MKTATETEEMLASPGPSRKKDSQIGSLLPSIKMATVYQYKVIVSSWLVISQTGMVYHGQWQDGSTAGDSNHQNMTSTNFRASVTSVKWDICSEH